MRSLVPRIQRSYADRHSANAESSAPRGHRFTQLVGFISMDIVLSKPQQPRRNRESGFTLLEIIVAVVIVTVLGAIAARGIFSKGDDAYANTAKTFFIDKAATAMTGLVGIAGQIPDIGDDELKDRMTARGLDGTTPWGGAWTVTRDNERSATFTYPVGGRDAENNATDIATDLADNTKYPHLSGVGSDGSNLEVTITVF